VGAFGPPPALADAAEAAQVVRRDLRLDVSAATPSALSQGQPQWLGARIIAPAKIDAASVAPIMVCVHGGTYDKRYFDLTVPGRTGYSMAAYFAARGFIVVALDYLGVSDSSRPAGIDKADRHVFAATQDAAAHLIFGMAAKGELMAHLPPLARIRKVGLGHSMGAMLTITQQANHATYDQLVLIGYSVRGVENARTAPPPPLPAVMDEAFIKSYLPQQRKRLRPAFYAADVPADVIAADEANAAFSPLGVSGQAQTAGVVLADAAKITVPVFFAVGEVDLSPTPHVETSYFTGSDDTSLFILKGSAHGQNTANTRAILWDRTLDWSSMVGKGGSQT
jgi:pimeloyl-ACP methyl ester carboxylesterase